MDPSKPVSTNIQYPSTFESADRDMTTNTLHNVFRISAEEVATMQKALNTDKTFGTSFNKIIFHNQIIPY